MNKQRLSLVNVTGRLGLLTYGRINKEKVAESLYTYDIQSNDEGFEPYAISETVLIHHWGTLITKEPLALNKVGWLYLYNIEDFQYVGDESLTINEFINLSNDQYDELLYNIPIEKMTQSQ